MLNLPTSMTTPLVREAVLASEFEPIQRQIRWCDGLCNHPSLGLEESAQLPSKMAMAASTDAPSQIMAWQAAVMRTASSVVRW